MTVKPSILCVIADYGFVGDERTWIQKIREVSEVATANVHLHVRVRNVELAQFVDLAEKARHVVGDHVNMVLNGAPDLAIRMGYQGAHYREQQLSSNLVVPDLPIRSAAVHSKTTVARIQGIDFSYLLYSPVFRVTWKDSKPTGVIGLRQFCRFSDTPAIALGGVDLSNAIECLESGASGVAVTSAIMGSRHAGDITKKFIQLLQVFDERAEQSA